MSGGVSLKVFINLYRLLHYRIMLYTHTKCDHALYKVSVFTGGISTRIPLKSYGIIHINIIYRNTEIVFVLFKYKTFIVFYFKIICVQSLENDAGMHTNVSPCAYI